MPTQGEHNDWVAKKFADLEHKIGHLFKHSNVPLVTHIAGPIIVPKNLVKTNNLLDPGHSIDQFGPGETLSATQQEIQQVPPAPPLVVPPTIKSDK